MKNKGLQIGNLFVEENTNTIIEVVGLEKERVVFSGMFLENWQAKPINLNEEWIYKLGFEKLTSKDKGYKQSSYVNKTGFKLYLCMDNGVMTLDFINGVTYKYVHQLQNLYQSLTGEKLLYSA